MRTAIWCVAAYLGTQVILQPVFWMMDVDSTQHAGIAIYAALAPIVLAVGMSLIIFPFQN